MRVRMLAGNWKMNKTIAELQPFFDAFGHEVGLASDVQLTERVDLLFAVPYPLLERATRLAEPRGIRIAAQNVHFEASGAFTGEVSLPMLRELGVTASLIGHSERRQYFGETDQSVARKTRAAVEAGFLPIVCVGETLAERERGETEAVVTRQTRAFLDELKDPGELVVAYEPVWAIGTGRSATSAQAQEVHKLIRGLLATKFGAGVAGEIRILYGGSATPANIEELVAQPDIDGALVGGASLKAADFARMVRSAVER
jgi:triosephosphate isomerase